MALAQASVSGRYFTLLTARRNGRLPSSGYSQASAGAQNSNITNPANLITSAPTMDAKLPPRLGIVIMIGIAILFGANHVAARVAFDAGASVATGVLVRAAGTAVFLVVLRKAQGTSFAIPRPLLPRALLLGVAMAVQSYCLYSAVARIPAALALLVFHTCPILFLLLSWATGKEPPRLTALAPMLLALFGLGLALDLGTDRMWPRLSELGAGVLWAFGAAVKIGRASCRESAL